MFLVIIILAIMIAISDKDNSRRRIPRRRTPIGGFHKPTIHMLKS